jgi:hypothetical protein
MMAVSMKVRKKSLKNLRDGQAFIGMPAQTALIKSQIKQAIVV